MGQGGALSGAGLTRRTLLAAGVVALAGCDGAQPAPVAWVGAHADRGHRLRAPHALPAPAQQRRAAVLIVGTGIAGLAAARACIRAGIDDVQLFELEDEAGGNSRGHVLAGMACPLGAHYLPLPAPESYEVAEWLHEIGLLRTEHGRSVADERHLCHSLQERLYIAGAWVEGLLPPAAPGSVTLGQYRRLAAEVARLQTTPGGHRAFTLPAHRAPWDAEQQALNATSFAAWLDGRGLDDAMLRWYLDYCCRDDYGAPADTVSAWAGVHYYASRRGFHAPGDADAESDPVFTWPEGNAWLARRLSAPLGERVHTGRSVLRVTERRHDVEVLAWDGSASRVEAWTAPLVVLALPLFAAARVVESPPEALRQAAALLSYAPWLVANVHLAEPLLTRIGAPPAWDNVVYGSTALGYVDAMHQSLRPYAGATVLTAYQALPATQRAALLGDEAGTWAARVLDGLAAVHPDIGRRVHRIDLMRWGHAMAVPRPGVHRHPALQALRAARGRVRYAHADLAGYSVFEEAFTAGCEVVEPCRSRRPSAGCATLAGFAT